MIAPRYRLAQVAPETPIAPLTRDWAPWIIGGAIILSTLLTLMAKRGHR